MPRKPKPEKPSAEILAPVPADILDQFVREGPRDGEGRFEPPLIGKHERRVTGFDDKVIALYARGLPVRAIQAFLKAMYAVEVSPDLMSAVTDAGVAEVTAWQSRPLEARYPVVVCDALRVTIRAEATVRSKAVARPLAGMPDGTRDILGIWIEQTEGATFWVQVFTDLNTRGGQDILIAVTDGLKGMAEALAASYPPPDAADLPRPSHSRHPGVRRLETQDAPGRRASGDRHRPERRGGATRARRVRSRPLGSALSHDRQRLAPRLGARESVLRFPAGGAPRA